VVSLPRDRDGGDDSWSAFCCDACSCLCRERWIEGENGRRGGGEELRGASRSVWECVKQISREGPYKHLYIFTTIFGFAMYIRLSSHKVLAQ
jgi:hypothetical protein